MGNEQINQTAQMLEDSRSEMEGKWLTFWMDKQLFGVSIAHVEQIVSMQPITEIPEYPMYAKGIISLRGNIIPLIDLRLCLGKSEAAYNDHTCIIIISTKNGPFGLIVDEVDAVSSIPSSAITPPPKMGEDAASQYLTGVARIPGEDEKEKIILCVDAAKILREDEYESLKDQNEKENEL